MHPVLLQRDIETEGPHHLPETGERGLCPRRNAAGAQSHQDLHASTSSVAAWRHGRSTFFTPEASRLPCVVSFTVMTGASEQHPRHDTFLQGEEAVGGGLAHLHAQVILEGAGDGLGATDVAGRAVADPHHVASHRVEAELRVERGHPVDVGHGDAGLLVDLEDGGHG